MPTRPTVVEVFTVSINAMLCVYVVSNYALLREQITTLARTATHATREDLSTRTGRIYALHKAKKVSFSSYEVNQMAG